MKQAAFSQVIFSPLRQSHGHCVSSLSTPGKAVSFVSESQWSRTSSCQVIAPLTSLARFAAALCRGAHLGTWRSCPRRPRSVFQSPRTVLAAPHRCGAVCKLPESCLARSCGIQTSRLLCLSYCVLRFAEGLRPISIRSLPLLLMSYGRSGKRVGILESVSSPIKQK